MLHSYQCLIEFYIQYLLFLEFELSRLPGMKKSNERAEDPEELHTGVFLKLACLTHMASNLKLKLINGRVCCLSVEQLDSISDANRSQIDNIGPLSHHQFSFVPIKYIEEARTTLSHLDNSGDDGSQEDLQLKRIARDNIM